VKAATSKKILCVEDDRETAALIAEELTERGYVVTIAYDGSEGLHAIRTTTPDLVPSDINMGRMSGLELLAHLAPPPGPRAESLPFIFLTALDDRDNELAGWELGADDRVTKPVDFDVLAARLAARLAQGARNKSSSSVAQLDQREIEVLTWAARGKNSTRIAQILGLTKRTVDYLIAKARTKLGVATRTQAVI
jgi:DNA-binding response OmpR family regulator